MASMNERLTLHFDGGSRGNPGIAGTGVVVAAEDGTPLITIGRYIGRATNNVAEYSALIDALRQAKSLGATKIIVRGDSELVIKQMRGEYRVKNPGLKPLYAQAAKLAEDFESVQFIHNLRHENSLADRLANLAMDRKTDVTDPGELTHTSPAPAQERNRIVCPNCGTEIDIDDPKH
jgi:ribonuclease HI